MLFRVYFGLKLTKRVSFCESHLKVRSGRIGHFSGDGWPVRMRLECSKTSSEPTANYFVENY